MNDNALFSFQVAADKYKCDSFKFDKLVGCILRSGFEGHTMSRKHVAIIFTAGDDLTSSELLSGLIYFCFFLVRIYKLVY